MPKGRAGSRTVDGVTPAAWGGTLSEAPTLSSDASNWSSAMLRHWRNTSPDMEQPPLDRHCIVLHLGGAKRVTRRSGAVTTTFEVAGDSLTTIGAGATYSWRTEGPIEFAHLYMPCDYLALVASELGHRASAHTTLADRVGIRSDRLTTLFRLMLQEIETPRLAPAFLMDVLLHNFAAELVRQQICLTAFPARHAMAPRRLRRVLDHIETHFATDLRLADLAAIAGTSPYHFSRAFHHDNGLPPYRYLIGRRVYHARALLSETGLSIAEVAEQCGFNSPRQFAIAFRQHVGVSPSVFRRES